MIFHQLVLAAGRRPGRLALLFAIVLLTLFQLLVLPSSWAADPTAEVSHQQLMGERNSRIQKLQQTNGSIFQQILDEQASDRAALKRSSLNSEQRRDEEEEINRHYSELMKALDVRKKDVEARIYAIWKDSGVQLQSGTVPDEQRWNTMDNLLSGFEESFFSSITEKSSAGPEQQALAEHLETCSPLEQKFAHPFTGDFLTRSIKGLSGENCHYVEELPANGRMECFYPREKLAQIADFYLHPERFDGAEIRSRTEFVDGEPVSTTEYIVDGKPVFHPLNDSIEKGECQVLGYN